MTTEPKERPILFSGPMVRAILAGLKTMTRRVVRIPPGWAHDFRFSDPMDGKPGAAPWPHLLGADGRYHRRACPYGLPGDRLWVRETWAPKQFEAGVNYRATGDLLDTGHCRWKPSIHMPRRASRILLEVTDVRVERLQDITDHDVCYEGLQATEFMPVLKHRVIDGYLHGEDQKAVIDGFRKLWESINGPDSWDADPWVWVVSFKRVEPST